jgi:hypothetical protein
MSGAGLYPDYEKGGQLSVVLSVSASGKRVFSGTARCDEETTFEIEHDGDDFTVTKIVTEPLLDETPGP